MLFLLTVFVGGILLQIFLSDSESKWPGLILPVIAFFISAVYFLILLAIYAACRGKQNSRRIKDNTSVQ